MRKFIFLSILLAATFMTRSATAKFPNKALGSCSDFTSYEQIGTLIADYADTYSDFARALSLGTSVEGRDIWALHLSADPDAESAEPEIRITGSIHGDECLCVDVVLEIIEWLVTGYGDQPLPSDLIDGSEILLVPLLNPDGYASNPAQRENAHGVDLNRNLGFAWLNVGETPFSEPETRALREISQERSFTLGLSYHTVATYVNGPWNYTPHHPLDEGLFDAIGDAYAGSSSYNVVFGWDWYSINGDVNDWSLGTRGTFDWTIELMSDYQMQWHIHEPGAAEFLQWIFNGVEGTVTDSDTGEPLAARIHVDPPGEPVFTDPDVGDYHRILLPGTYDITAVANGYETAVFEGVVVPDGDAITLDFELDPGGDYAALAINRMIIPEPLPNLIYEFIEYENHTRPAAVLSVEDDAYYSMSPGGSITVDMGWGTEVTDGEGPDLLVLSGTDSADPVTVSVAEDQDGPFTEVGNGTGDLELDLEAVGVESARFVRVMDKGDGPFNDPQAGYDLDAVINLSPPPATDTDVDTDSESDSGTDTDSDSDSDADTDVGPEPDSGPPITPPASGCGCRIVYPSPKNWLSLVL